jgi:hypothetical protein
MKTNCVVNLFHQVEILTRLEKEAPANFRASSRGNTGGASVIQNDWA